MKSSVVPGGELLEAELTDVLRRVRLAGGPYLSRALGDLARVDVRQRRDPHTGRGEEPTEHATAAHAQPDDPDTHHVVPLERNPSHELLAGAPAWLAADRVIVRRGRHAGEADQTKTAAGRDAGSQQGPPRHALVLRLRCHDNLLQLTLRQGRPALRCGWQGRVMPSPAGDGSPRAAESARYVVRNSTWGVAPGGRHLPRRQSSG